MAERTSVTQILQLGLETTPGTAVPANKLLPSIMLTSGIDGSFVEVRTNGFKYSTDQVIGKEWSTAKISGMPTYDELTYLLSSALVKVTPATSDTTARTWTMAPSSSSEDVVATYTVEQGSAVRANKFPYGIVSEFSLKGDRDKIELGGAMIGQLFNDGISLTGSPTAVAQVPVFPKEVDIYFDPTTGGLGTTKFTRVLAWEINIRNRFAPLWVVDSSKTSWAATVEMPIDAKLKVTMEADAQGMGLLTQMRNSAFTYCRVKATSPTLAGAATAFYGFSWDFALNVAGTPKEISDKEGVYALDWEFAMVHDGTWGKAQSMALVNKLTAL
jgi:hypothetical protein